MLRSMTGYGTASVDADGLRATASARSLNHRYFDLTLHLSRRLQSLEPEVKRLVQERVQRGRVEVVLQAQLGNDAGAMTVAEQPIVAGLVRAMREAQAAHGLGGEVTISDVARFPGAFDVAEGAPDLDDASRSALLVVIGRALEGLDEMRRSEGVRLDPVLRASLDAVAAAAERIGQRWQAERPLRVQAGSERARQLKDELGLDEPRLYQEIVRLVDRSDVAEELQRLRSHVAAAREALASDAPCGKRLDFLAQELAREANTIGSKSVSGPIVAEVVELKSEIERLREQVQNVE